MRFFSHGPAGIPLLITDESRGVFRRCHGDERKAPLLIEAYRVQIVVGGAEPHPFPLVLCIEALEVFDAMHLAPAHQKVPASVLTEEFPKPAGFRPTINA